MRIALLAAATLSLSALVACEETECTLEAAGSVNVTVEDELGDPIVDATVTYSTDEVTDEACENMGGENVWVCGWEVDGDITVTASAEWHDTAEETVTVELTEDGCHVVPEAITLSLLMLDSAS